MVPKKQKQKTPKQKQKQSLSIEKYNTIFLLQI